MVTLGLLAVIAYATAATPAQAPEGFRFREIRFDESMGEKKPTPYVPKEWRLVSVANGSAVNSQSLWFQDDGGQIYMINGFIDHNGSSYVLRPEIWTLPRK